MLSTAFWIQKYFRHCQNNQHCTRHREGSTGPDDFIKESPNPLRAKQTTSLNLDQNQLKVKEMLSAPVWKQDLCIYISLCRILYAFWITCTCPSSCRSSEMFNLLESSNKQIPKGFPPPLPHFLAPEAYELICTGGNQRDYSILLHFCLWLSLLAIPSLSNVYLICNLHFIVKQRCQRITLVYKSKFGCSSK